MQIFDKKIGLIFFIGIGGIGMSGIAEVLKNLGFSVKGSDITDNQNVRRLKNLGIEIFIGHSRKLLVFQIIFLLAFENSKNYGI